MLAVISHEFTRRLANGLPELEWGTLLVETFGGFRHYYFCVAPEVDLEASVRPIARRFPAEKLSWEYRATPGWEILRSYATSATSPPIDSVKTQTKPVSRTAPSLTTRMATYCG
jgi:hypothetical protein